MALFAILGQQDRPSNAALYSRAMPARPPREVAREVLEIESQAIRDLLPQLDEAFDRAVELLRSCRGRVVCTGIKPFLDFHWSAAHFHAVYRPCRFRPSYRARYRSGRRQYCLSGGRTRRCVEDHKWRNHLGSLDRHAGFDRHRFHRAPTFEFQHHLCGNRRGKFQRR